MKKLLFALLTISLTVFGMEDATQDNDDDFGHIIYVKNPDAAECYDTVIKRYNSSDEWWRETHAVGTVSENSGWEKDTNPIKLLWQTIEEAKSLFGVVAEDTILTNHNGLIIEMKTIKFFSLLALQGHYFKSPYIYKVIADKELRKEFLRKILQNDAQRNRLNFASERDRRALLSKRSNNNNDDNDEELMRAIAISIADQQSSSKNEKPNPKQEVRR